ncbi:MAG TPA: hypothetical protein VH558_18620 [Pseudolabrys sp.]|jgi:hypothetical protein
MKHMIIALAAAGTLAAALPSSAQAHCRDCGVAAGVVGGLAAGAIIGSAIANSGPVYVEPAPVYVAPPPVYVEPAETIEDGVCHIERRKIWMEGYGWRSRGVEVCD